MPPAYEYPTPSGALYVKPNPDGTKKRCDNCMMWVKTKQCAIHPKGTKVTKSMVCGYHVYGKPMDEWMDHPGIDPVDPKFSGLEEVGDGTNCATCHHYEDDKCHAVAPGRGKKPPIPVESNACCALWIKRKTEEKKSAAFQLGVVLGKQKQGPLSA